MAVAAQHEYTPSTAARRPSRAELKRALAEMEARLWREGLRVRNVRDHGGDVAPLERRWSRLLRSYERLSQYLSESA